LTTPSSHASGLATVPGYHAILALQGKEYDYRVSGRGAFILCKRRSR
jgi:hypothetical protein